MKQSNYANMPMNVAWDDLRLILALARGQTLAGAAEKLQVDTSTVFRGIRAIEKRLVVTLFDRSRKGFSPTAFGERLVQSAERIEREMLDLEAQLTGQQTSPSGILRISTTDSVLFTHLLPNLSDFNQQYPQIHLELVASNEAVNLSRRDADVVIRATPTPPEYLVGRRLGDLFYAIYASPEYWRAHSSLPMAQQTWLSLDDSFGDHPTSQWRREQYPDVEPRHRFNSMFALNRAISAGAGIGLLPNLHDPVSSKLVSISEPIKILKMSLWILTHPDLRNQPRVRAFMDFCATIFHHE